MNILLDMNIPLAWIPILEEAGYVAVHWSNVGSIYARVFEIMKWAREYDFIFFKRPFFSLIILPSEKKNLLKLLWMVLKPTKALLCLSRNNGIV